jgi:uncharacterized protein (TIGR02757 family)
MNEMKDFLSQIELNYQRVQFLSSDPIEFVHNYDDPWDQEAIALLSALLAYGNVRQIRNSIQDATTRIFAVAKSPHEFVSSLANPNFLRKALNQFDGYVHRFNSGRDLIRLFQLLGNSWKEHGSLGAHFLSYLTPQAQTIETALNTLIKDWKSAPTTFPFESSFNYLLTAPQDGSCCKRWCMLLRWMGRKDEVDLGLWSKGSKLQATFPQGRSLNSRQLVMPLDTHTGRLSQSLGLTQRKSLNWKAALEVTESFRTLDPLDPVRYDFALSRWGMLKGAKTIEA